MTGGEIEAAGAPETGQPAKVVAIPLNDAQRALVMKFGAVVDKEARKLAAGAGRAIGFDELAAYGRSGLVNAARNYDDEFGVPFEAYAVARVRWAIWDGIRTELPHMRALATAAMALCNTFEQSWCDFNASEEEERAWVDTCNNVGVTSMLAAYTWSAARDTEQNLVELNTLRRNLEALEGGMATLSPEGREFLREHYEQGRSILDIARPGT